jgi:hypothetical protein
MIPNIVHFCFGMTPDFGGRPFSLSHYLSVRSAWEVLKPDCMLMHCVHEPEGEWWELAKPYLHVHKLAPICRIFGFPTAHPAHRADIVRLAALIAMGGIYLDTDVLVVRPFAVVEHYDFAAARELTADGRVVGLSNAVLLSERDSEFARLCLQGHDPAHSLWYGFRSKGRDENYVEMSVRYPAMLANLCPVQCKVLPSETFLWADWSDEGLHRLFEENVTVPEGVLAIHLWESHAWDKYLSALKPEEVRGEATTFNRLAARFLPGTPVGSHKAVKGMVDRESLDRMRALCSEVDSGSATVTATTWGRASRFFWRWFRKVREEWNAPLRSQLQILEERLSRIESQMGVLPEANSEQTPASGEQVFLRTGPHDGSRELISRHLPERNFSALMITAGNSEPCACRFLAMHPDAATLWASGSLRRASRLGAWMKSAGSACRCIYHPSSDPEKLVKLITAGFEGVPDLILLAGTDFDPEQLKTLGTNLPTLILVARPPLLPREIEGKQKGTDVVPIVTYQETLQTGLAELRYKRLEHSADGQYQLYGSKESAVAFVSSGRPKPVFRSLSIYGDDILV